MWKADLHKGTTLKETDSKRTIPAELSKWSLNKGSTMHHATNTNISDLPANDINTN